MLVLTRKAKQQIQIGPNITITVLQIKGQSVRLGIEAPQQMTVLRTEVAKRDSSNKHDPTVQAAAEKFDRESAISAGATYEEEDGQHVVPAPGSPRCREPRVDEAPLSEFHQSPVPASLLRPRRRRRLIAR